MQTSHPFIQKMLLQILTWNNYNIYYLAKRLNISKTTVLNALYNKPINSDDQLKIISYYLAYASCFQGDHH